jgi:hypothetical protein
MSDYKSQTISMIRLERICSELDYDKFVEYYETDIANGYMTIENVDKIWKRLLDHSGYFEDQEYISNNNVDIDEFEDLIMDAVDEFAGDILDENNDEDEDEDEQKVIIPELKLEKLKISKTHEVSIHPFDNKDFMGDTGIKTFYFDKGEKIFTKTNVDKMNSAEKYLCFHFNDEEQKLRCLKGLHERDILKDDIYVNKNEATNVIIKK